MTQNSVGRPPLSEKQKEETRGKLLNHAREAFLKEGFQSVSIRKIANAANCNPMTFYKYFDSKQALLRCLWGEFFEELFSISRENESKQTSCREKVCAFIRTYAQYWWKYPDRYRLVFMVEDRLVNEIDSYYVENHAIQVQFQKLQNYIQAAIDNNDIVASDAELTTQLLLTGVSGILHFSITISEINWFQSDRLLEAMLEAHLPTTSLK